MRIAGVNLPKNKRVEIGLTYIYGVGRATSVKILEALKIDKNMRVEDITEEDSQRIRDALAKYTIEGDLRRKVTGDIKRLQDIGTYRGYRHRRKLPVRGQRTKTNARTKRGKRVTMGSGRIKEQKT